MNKHHYSWELPDIVKEIMRDRQKQIDELVKAVCEHERKIHKAIWGKMMNKEFWERIDKLEELAEKATQGEWAVYNLSKVFSVEGGNNLFQAYSGFDSEGHKWDGKVNALYVAAANPAMILEMIAVFKGRLSYLEHKLIETDIQLGIAKQQVEQLEKEADWLAEELASVYKSEFEGTMDLLDASDWRKEAREAIAENKNV